MEFFEGMETNFRRVRKTILDAKSAGVSEVRVLKAENVVAKARRDISNANTIIVRANKQLKNDMVVARGGK